MQIDIAEFDYPETAATFTLRVPTVSFVGFGATCPLCESRSPVWIADPASDVALDPDNVSPIKASGCCTVCLNALVDDAVVSILAIRPESF